MLACMDTLKCVVSRGVSDKLMEKKRVVHRRGKAEGQTSGKSLFQYTTEYLTTCS